MVGHPHQFLVSTMNRDEIFFVAMDVDADVVADVDVVAERSPRESLVREPPAALAPSGGGMNERVKILTSR